MNKHGRRQQGSFVVVNASDKDWTKHRYVLAFGAYGDTKLLVYGNHLADAFDEAIDWIADNAPGLLCNAEVEEAYNAAVAEGQEEERAWESATVDTACGGNGGDYMHAWEWCIVAEDPSREELIAIRESTR